MIDDQAEPTYSSVAAKMKSAGRSIAVCWIASTPQAFDSAHVVRA